MSAALSNPSKSPMPWLVLTHPMLTVTWISPLLEWHPFRVDGFADPLGDFERSRTIGARKQDDELLAAKPRKNIDRAQDRLTPVNQRLQHDVTAGVTVRVVDALEMVCIDHQHRYRAGIAQRQGELVFGHFEEASSVRGARQVVGGQQAAQLVGRHLSLGDIPQNNGEARFLAAILLQGGNQNFGTRTSCRRASGSDPHANATLRGGHS